MTRAAEDLRTVVVERDIPHPPQKVWRALTTPHLLSEWLMNNDIAPKVGHDFKFTADWGSVDCRVLTVEVDKVLAYTWTAFGAGTVVTWTLDAAGAGTRLRVEQSGFPPAQEQAFRGATAGWPRFFTALEAVLDREA